MTDQNEIEKWYLIDLNKRTCIDIINTLMLGREGGDINFPNDKMISRIHMSLKRKNSNIFITDLGSTNGTILNGKVIKKKIDIQIMPNDEIKIGAQHFVAVNHKQYFDKFWEEKSIIRTGFADLTEQEISRVIEKIKSPPNK